MSAIAEKSPREVTPEPPYSPAAASTSTNNNIPESPNGDKTNASSTPIVVPAATAAGAAATPAFMMPGMPGMQFVPYMAPVVPNSNPSGDNGEGPAQPQQAGAGPAMMIHPAFLSQMYGYPYGPGMVTPGLKLKRKQVKNACTNCQKACKKCDDERPCSRCVKYGIADECADSVRKERRKGIKRGSYKKKPLPGEEGADEPATPQAQQFMTAYPTQIYAQWAAAAAAAQANAKPGENPQGYYPYFITAAPPGASGSGEGSSSAEGNANSNNMAAAQQVAAQQYLAQMQMYYAAAAQGGGFAMAFPGAEGAGGGTGGSGGKGKQTQQKKKLEAEESEEELEYEDEESEDEPESPKKKTAKKKGSEK